MTGKGIFRYGLHLQIFINTNVSIGNTMKDTKIVQKINIGLILQFVLLAFKFTFKTEAP